MLRPDTRSRTEGHLIALGPYTLVEVVGRGAAGAVWRAVHDATDTPLAIHVLDRAEADVGGALHQEGAVLCTLRSPYLAAVHDLGVVDAAAAASGGLAEGAPWLALEWLPHGPVSPDDVRDWRGLRRVLMDALLGLAHAHARGVLHRDVKPGNLLVAAREPARVKLADFGIAFARGAWESGGGAPAAGLTPRYAAPEQILGRLGAQGPWTDLYGLGGVAFTLATGRPPYADVTRADAVLAAQLREPLPDPQARFALPPGFRPWLDRMSRKAPEERFRSAADALDALLGIDRLLRVGRRHWAAEPDPDGPPPGAADPGPGVLAARRPPFVGREPERDRLWALLYDTSVDRVARAVVVHGPPGSGKSALGSWLAHRADEVGVARVARGGRDGLAGLVARHLGGAPDRPDAVEEGLAARGGVPDAAALVDWLRGAELPAGRRFELAAQALGAGLDRPLLAWVDGPADPDLVAFARWLVTGRVLPALVVFTPSDVADVAALRARMPLAEVALDAPSAELLAAVVAATGAVHPETAARIADRAAGDARLVVDILREVAPALGPSEGGWRLPRSREVHLPADARARAEARVEGLLSQVPRSLPALRVAAVLGPEGRCAEWEAVCRRTKILVPPALPAAMRRSGLLVGDRLGDPAALDALRARLGPNAGALHAAAAAVLRELDADPLRLGRHLWQSGDPEAARTVLRGALRPRPGAPRSWVRDAVSLDILERIVPRDDPARAELLWARVERARVTGRMEAALDAIRKLLTLARRSGDGAAEIQALVQRAVLRVEAGDDAGALRDVAAADRAAAAVPAGSAVRDLARTWGGLVLARAGHFPEAAARFAEGTSYHDRLGAGMLALDRGDPAGAEVEFARAERELPSAGPLNAALLATARADTDLELGRVDAAHRRAAEALEALIALRTGYVGDARVVVGFARLAAGRPGDAELAFRLALGDAEDARRAAIGGLVLATARQHLDPRAWVEAFEVGGVRMSFHQDRRLVRCLLAVTAVSEFRKEVRKLAAAKAVGLAQRNGEAALLAEASAAWAALAS